jgi:hemin uptake protein HemP
MGLQGGVDMRMRIIIITRMTAKPLQRAPTASPPTSRASSIPRVTSRELLGAAGQLVIAHGGREYRLRITQNGKLILTA